MWYANDSFMNETQIKLFNEADGGGDTCSEHKTLKIVFSNDNSIWLLSDVYVLGNEKRQPELVEL